MKIPAKTEYACLAVLELAERYGEAEPVRVGAIARRHHVPPRFLVQILLQLKAAGLVGSVRGAAGGYHLLKAPAETSLGEVMEVIEGSAKKGDQAAGAASNSPAAKVLFDVWQDVAEAQQRILHEISFADLLDRARKQDKPVYYI